MSISELLSTTIHVIGRQIPVGLSGEIISRSQIGREFIWPETDPRLQWQPQRVYGSDDESRVRCLSISPHFDMDKFLEKTKALDLP